MVDASMQLARRFWRVMGVPNKLKILLGFFQIVVVVEKVYELTLPVAAAGVIFSNVYRAASRLVTSVFGDEIAKCHFAK